MPLSIGLVRFCCSAACCLLISCAVAPAPDSVITVSSLEELQSEVSRALPGTTIKVAAGEYYLGGRLELSGSGTADRPVRVTGRNTVRILGRGGLTITDSRWLVLEGMSLHHEPATLDIRRSDHIRVSRMRVQYRTTDDAWAERSVVTHWIRFRDGTGHRIDRSEIGPHPGGLGVTVLIENTVRSVTIDRNHFHTRPRDGRNGAETIRIGSGGWRTIAATIENNLFQSCDGEGEIISIKANGTVIRRNTFYDNWGDVVIRSGNDAVIAENHFIGAGSGKRVGGIRVHGENIHIINNHFRNLATPAIRTFTGDHRAGPTDSGAYGEPETLEGGYRQAVNVTVLNNLLVNEAGNDQSFLEVARRTQSEKSTVLAPQDWVISGNILVTGGPMTSGDRVSGLRWQANVLATTETTHIREARELDFDLALYAPSLERDATRNEDSGSATWASSGRLPPPLRPEEVGPDLVGADDPAPKPAN